MQEYKGQGMTTEEIVKNVEEICRKEDVCHLDLFGSYSKGTQTKYSDVDFVVYGVKNISKLREKIDDIPTLKKIDIFDYDSIQNIYLREDMDRYGKRIY